MVKSRILESYNGIYYNGRRICIFERDEWDADDISVYSAGQRLWYINYDVVFKEYLGRGQYLSEYKPSEIEKFLCALLEEPIMLTGVIEEYGSMSDDYPSCMFFYKNKEMLESLSMLDKQKEGIPKDIDKMVYSDMIDTDTFLIYF